MDPLIDSSGQRLRTALARIPDGEASAENFLDGDAVVERPIRVALRVIKEGVRRPIRFVLPSGTVVNPVSPAPVNSYVPTVHLVYNAVMEAIGKLAPDRAVADTGVGLGAMTFGYAHGREGRGYVHYEIPVTGLGGTSQSDGCPSILPVANLESVQPIEVVESEFPVRVTDFSMWPDSAGAGLRREFEVLEDTQFVSRLSQRRHGARGIACESSSRAVAVGGIRASDRPRTCAEMWRTESFRWRALGATTAGSSEAARSARPSSASAPSIPRAAR